MKRFRIPLIVAAIVVGVLVLAGLVLFNASFQTWVARRALASQPDLRGTIGRVSVGLGRVVLRDVRLEHEGAMLTLPAADVRLPVLAAIMRDEVQVAGLDAKGWMLDLSKWQSKPAAKEPRASAARKKESDGSDRLVGSVGSTGASKPAATGTSPATAAQPRESAPASPRPFHGIFDSLELPFDLALEGLDLAGAVVLPESRGRVQVALAGGGVASGREGRLSYRADAALSDPKVNAAAMRGVLVVQMDTPRTLRQVRLEGDASASGTRFPKGIQLSARASAARRSGAESYSAGVATEGRQVLLMAAELPRDAALLSGTWKLDLRDSDLVPFALGRPVPSFTLAGEGRFDTDATFAEFHAAGRVNGSASELRVLLPQLAEVDRVTLAADFDLGRRGEAVSIRKLEADLGSGRPVARLQALQPFEFNVRTAALRAENADRELFDLVLHAVPVAWAKPFVPSLTVTGGDVRGELVTIMRAGGTTLRTRTPLTLAGASVAHGADALLGGVDLSLAASADYTPHGWQAEVDEFKATAGETTVLSAAAKAGQLPGPDQPLKATGRIALDLPAILAQPVAAGKLALTRGEASVEFAASLANKKEIQATVALTNLVAPVPPRTAGSGGTEQPPAKPAPADLPAVSAVIRADLAADGQLSLNAPIVIERDTRKSDLTITGTIKTAKDVCTVEAQVASEHLVVDDARLLAALLPPETGQPGDTERDRMPKWAGFRGTVGLQLKKVIYSDTFQASDVAGTLRLDEAALRIESMRMGLGEGDAWLDGGLTFNPDEPKRYGLSANLALRDFDPGPLLRALNPRQAPTVEGRFAIRSDLAARAGTVGALAAGVEGEVEVTSRGGVFRGLPVSVGNLVENTSKLAAWLSSAGSAIGALTGKKDEMDVTSKAQAIAELAKGLNPITFDQLSVRLSRDAALNTTLRDFTLISPEIRLTGGGRTTHRVGGAWLDEALAMEFRLRARGRPGELLKYLGMLESEPDNLGYSACTLPLAVGGTFGAPDTSEINQRLVALALDKSGLGERASEMLQKLRGAKNGGD